MQVSGRYRRIPYIWATVNIWYIAPSHQFLKSVLSFFRFWYTSKSYRCLKSALSFFKPQFNFQNIKMSRILLSINLNFGCSSCLGLLATCEKVELLPCPAFRINEAERIYVAVSQDSTICRYFAIMHFQAQPLQDSP